MQAKLLLEGIKMSRSFVIGVSSPNGPCKGCTDRTVEPINCHSVCERYLAWSKTRKEALDHKYTIKGHEAAIVESKIDYIRKCRKKRHGRT